MYGLLNIGSLALGLLAWLLPVAQICTEKAPAGLHTLSFLLCSLSLAFQIFYTRHLALIRDWSAIEDTQGAVAFAAAALLTVTLLLNGIAAVVRKCRKK